MTEIIYCPISKESQVIVLAFFYIFTKRIEVRNRFSLNRNDGVDELNWERLEARSELRYPQTDHTTGDREGYYVGLSRDNVQKPGDRALLLSQEMPGSDKSHCVSFWYYMYEPIVDNTGPNLGKLGVWIRTFDRNDNLVMKPVWRLQNGQGPSWKYAQARIDSDTNYQVLFFCSFISQGLFGIHSSLQISLQYKCTQKIPKKKALESPKCMNIEYKNN